MATVANAAKQAKRVLTGKGLTFPHEILVLVERDTYKLKSHSVQLNLTEKSRTVNSKQKPN